MAKRRSVAEEDARRGAWRRNQEVELADWDALDLDVLASDREMWSAAGSAPGGGAEEERRHARREEQAGGRRV